MEVTDTESRNSTVRSSGCSHRHNRWVCFCVSSARTVHAASSLSTHPLGGVTEIRLSIYQRTKIHAVSGFGSLACGTMNIIRKSLREYTLPGLSDQTAEWHHKYMSPFYKTSRLFPGVAVTFSFSQRRHGSLCVQLDIEYGYSSSFSHFHGYVVTAHYFKPHFPKDQ